MDAGEGEKGATSMPVLGMFPYTRTSETWVTVLWSDKTTLRSAQRMFSWRSLQTTEIRDKIPPTVELPQID